MRHSADVAALIAAWGETERAAMLFGAAAALAEATGFAASWPERGAHERAAAAARQALGDATFDAVDVDASLLGVEHVEVDVQVQAGRRGSNGVHDLGDRIVRLDPLRGQVPDL